MKVAFIGLGIMGSRMATRLAQAGIDLTVYNRDQSKAEALSEFGAKTVSSAAEAVLEADVVYTMLATPEVVHEVVFGEQGFVSQMKQGALWLDCSTVDPAFSREMGVKAQKAGIDFVDAPVAGTKQPAENGELVFLIGGKEENLSSVSSMLDIMGKKTIYFDETGNGSSMKMLINLMLAQSMAAFSEAVHLGTQMGMDENLVYSVLSNTPVSAPFLNVLQPKISADDVSANFPLKWMHKDLHLVSKVAYESGASMPLANLVKELFASAKDHGHGDDDFSTIYHFTTK